jgi:hypothetical protein
MIGARLVRRKVVEHKAVTKMVAAATIVAAAFFAGSGQGFPASSCAGGSVDGPAPQTPMCFGTMFPKLPAFHYSDQAAADLANTMENQTPDPTGIDRGTADDSATLPAEYTYLGQFIDHNLDFDETPQPTANVNPSSLTNFESFRFDLNDVFGGGPSVDPQLYASDHKHLLVSGTLGAPNPDGLPTVTGNGGVFDLFRGSSGQADIVEPRNDETQILSQIDAAFIAFYNDFIDEGDSYAQARQLTENYYQEIVLTDVLPAYVGQDTIDQYLRFGPNGQVHVQTKNFSVANFTPIEFSVGAYRFGHSLVRNNYHINDIDPTGADIDDNVSIFDLDNFQAGDLSGGAPLPGPNLLGTSSCTSTSLCTQPNPAGHQIQWKYFVPALDKNPNDAGINFARKTQTTISPALFNLPAESIAGCADAATSPVCNGSASIIARDFARGNYDGLASGQAIAQTLGCPVIPAKSINPTSDAVFDTGTPLLYYVLAEAQKSGQTLGCVGKSIVAQVFIQVLAETPGSILQTNFKPDPSLVKLAPETPAFSFGDLLVDTGLAPRSS